MVLRSAVLLLLLMEAAAGQTGRLRPGIPRRFSIAAQAEPFVLTGFTVPVPGGSSRLTIDLEADNLAHDLTLWARFDRDVTVQAGNVIGFDHFSQVVGSGREQIVLTTAGLPPLQSGTYYLAIGVATLNTAISGTITARIEGGGSLGTLIVSTFESDADGWTVNFPESTIPDGSFGEGASIVWHNAGGASGGFINVTEPGLIEIESRRDYLVAPPKFLGNLAAMTNPRLEFDYRHTAGGEAVATVVVRIIGNGGSFVWHSAEPPSITWTHHRIPLVIGRGALERTGGEPGNTLERALSNVVRIEVSVDQTVGGGMESNGFDNFALLGDLPPAAPATTPAAPVTATFDAGTEGWGRNYPPVGIAGASIGDSGSVLGWSREGGFAGGALEIRGAGAVADDFFVAPARFLGNLAALPNPRLEFDYRHVEPPFGQAPVAVRIVGAGASFIRLEANPAPFGQYQHYRTPLAADFFQRESGAASFEQALAAVQRIEISADQGAGAEVNYLDNVSLLSSTTPPVRPTMTLAPSGLSFTAVAGGANPAPQLVRIASSGDIGGPAGGGVLSWSATLDPPAAWLGISSTSGTTPSSVEVTINAAGLLARTYTGTISIAAPGAANTPRVLSISLSVTPSPATLPRISTGGIVNAASSRGPVAPGGLATLFGFNLGPVVGVEASFVPGTQTLPTALRGVRVLVRETGGGQIAEAPLLFVKENQINFQMPFEAAGRSSVQLAVDNGGLLSAPEAASIAPVAPGLFIFGANRAVAQNQDFSLNTAQSPAPLGGIIIAYLTGQGALSPGVPTGQAAPSSPPATATAAATATIGGAAARVLFLGMTPGLVGLAQANIQVPESLQPGEHTLLVTVGGQTTNGALVSVR